MRPANIVTAIADILAGVAIAGYVQDEFALSPVLWLALSTAALYGGGVVMNDFFDAELDKVERPERPIPSGIVPASEAALLGAVLFVAGISAAFLVSVLSGMLAFSITIAALYYDKWGKHFSFLGPINMGLCRGLNLLLGMSIIPATPDRYWFVALVPVIYIGAVTMISRGEVHGSGRKRLYAAAFLYLLAMVAVFYVSFLNDTLPLTIIFILLWSLLVFPPLFNAIRYPSGGMIGRAVKSGVIALILMNSSWAAVFGNFYMALLIVSLLPVSLLLAKIFAVT